MNLGKCGIGELGIGAIEHLNGSEFVRSIARPIERRAPAPNEVSIEGRDHGMVRPLPSRADVQQRSLAPTTPSGSLSSGSGQPSLARAQEGAPAWVDCQPIAER